MKTLPGGTDKSVPYANTGKCTIQRTVKFRFVGLITESARSVSAHRELPFPFLRDTRMVFEGWYENRGSFRVDESPAFPELVRYKQSEP